MFSSLFPPSTNTPLHTAVENRDLDIVELLLSKGVNVNARGDNGRTPLHLASGRKDAFINPPTANCDVDIIKILIKHGADVNARSIGGKTPLNYALENRCKDAVIFLLENGADPN